MYTEKSFDYKPIPIIFCPTCQTGTSTTMAEKIQEVGLWGSIDCCKCNQKFEIATAIDEMFVNTHMSGITLWTNGHQIFRPLTVKTGTAQLIDVKNIFEEVYQIRPWLRSGSGHLAGGISTKYIRQGFVMVSIAPFNNGIVNTVEMTVLIEGRHPNQLKMEPWKEMCLNAKLIMRESPELTIILAVNAVDLYLEEITNKNIGSGRPGSWNTSIENHFDIKLSKLLGSKFQNIEKFVQVRNAIAHGRDYLEKLPNDVVQLEKNWLKFRNYSEDPNVPSATFSLSCALEIIRACRRIIDDGKYIPVFKTP